MRERVHQRLSVWLFVVAGIALVVALVPTFFCVGERLALCDTGTLLGDVLRGSARGAWVVVSLSMIGGVLARIMGAGESSEGDILEAPVEFFQPVAAGASPVEPIALDMSLEFKSVSGGAAEEIEENPDSVMAFVQERVEHAEAQLSVEQGRLGTSVTEDGFYCPPGMETSQILYVDGQNEGLELAWEDAERIGDRERAFGTLAQAVLFARTLVVGTNVQVQIRIVPGVYTCDVQIPDRVVLVNDRMPAGLSGEEYAEWLAGQQEIGHPERVTLRAAADAEQAVLFLPGRMQGLYGCYLVGRDDVVQSGVRAVGCQLLRVFCCVIEGFSRRGVEFGACGSALPGAPIELVGSVLRGNSSRKGGGALFVHDSALRLEQCVFENNRARTGGAILAKNLKAPLLVKDCKLRRNRALGRRLSDEMIAQIGLEQWQNQEGMGGAIAILNSRLKVVDSRFDVNDAALGGGAIAVLGSRIAIECSLGQTFVQNRANIGGAVLAIGWKGAQSGVKVGGAVFQSCQAQYFGGGLALIGQSTAQFKSGHFYANHCADRNGVGGAVAVMKGAVFSAAEVRFSNNMSEGAGGALGVINATLRMSGQCTIKENEANGAGGGIYCVTVPDAEMERLAHEPSFFKPFALQLKDLRICGNRSGGAGSGLLAGNTFDYATFPLQIDMLESVHVYENFGEMSQAEILVLWAGETRFGRGDFFPMKALLG